MEPWNNSAYKQKAKAPEMKQGAITKNTGHLLGLH